MAEICQNCNGIIAESFCGNCGQKKYKRIDRKYLWDEIQYTLLHTNKGFLFSVKNILKNPGKTAKDFIDGNRVNHYKPILLVFVLSGISAFISYKILGFKEVMGLYFSQKHMNSKVMIDFMSFVSSYNSIIMLLLIPLFAITTKIAFRKWNNNYYEHIVMNAYISSYYTLVTIIFIYPILFFFKSSVGIFGAITEASMLLILPILIWFFREFYKEKAFKSVLLRVFGVLGITILGYFILIVLIVMAGIIFAAFMGPEALQYVKPK